MTLSERDRELMAEIQAKLDSAPVDHDVSRIKKRRHEAAIAAGVRCPKFSNCVLCDAERAPAKRTPEGAARAIIRAYERAQGKHPRSHTAADYRSLAARLAPVVSRALVSPSPAPDLDNQEWIAERWKPILSLTRGGGNGVVAAPKMIAEWLEVSRDAVYTERNKIVAVLAAMFPSGIARTDILGWEPEWHGCVYIDFPTGQVSWHYHDRDAHLFAHLPAYVKGWDGHTTDEKYERLAAFVAKRHAPPPQSL